MPFDGVLPLNVKSVVLPAHYSRIVTSRARRRRRITFQVCFLLAFLIFVPVLSECIYPGYGVITRLVMGNTYADQNMIGLDIARHGDVLQFEISGNFYQLVSPSHPLDATQTAAWIAFASRQKWPLYSIDGPLAYDP
jgi:hypothetical protein